MRSVETALLVVASGWLFAEQNVISPHLTAIASEFGMSEKEKDMKLGGQLQLAFFVVGSPASIALGIASDKFHRIRLLFFVILLGEIPCLAAYWARTFEQLVVLRCFAGVSIGGCIPLLYSLCGDMFSSQFRHLAATAVTTSVGAGIALGQILSGFIGERYGWRAVFPAVAIPAIVAGFAVLCFVAEPERGGQEDIIKEHREVCLSEIGHSEKEIIKSKDVEFEDIRLEDVPIMKYEAHFSFLLLFEQIKKPCNAMILGQGLWGTIPWSILNTFMVDYLHVNKSLSLSVSTAGVSAFGAGAMLGTIAGGWTGQIMHNKDSLRRFSPLAFGCTTALAAVPLYYVIVLKSYGHDYWKLYSCALLSGLFSGVSPPNIRALLLSVNPPETRGSIFSMYSHTDDVGRGLGPIVVATVSSSMGRQQTYAGFAFCWVVCGSILSALYFFLQKDIEKVRAHVKSRTTEIGD